MQLLSDQQRIKQLECENKELQRSTEILRKAAAFCIGGIRPPTQIMVDFIHDYKAQYSVEAICQILPIAPSIYCRQLDLTQNPEKRADDLVKRDFNAQHPNHLWSLTYPYSDQFWMGIYGIYH